MQSSVDWKYSGIAKTIDTNESWLQDVLLKAWLSDEFFATYFMGDEFKLDGVGEDAMTVQRSENFRALGDNSLAYGGVVAHRGFGKTAQLIAHLVKSILFRQFCFIVYASRTTEFASDQTENIKSRLLQNDFIKACWGDLTPKVIQGKKASFSASSWFVTDPRTGLPFAYVVPKGAGQQVNGLLINLNGVSHRPDFLVVDDGEDRTEVLSEENRRKYSKWLHGAYLQTVSTSRPNPKTNRWDNKIRDPFAIPPWRCWYQDTIKHEASEMQHLLTDKQWSIGFYPQGELNDDDEVTTLAPELISSAQLQVEYDFAKTRPHLLDVFAMEKLCVPQAKSGGTWNQKLFKYYNEREEKLNDLPEKHRFIIVDPASTSNPHACPSAWLAVAARTDVSRVFLRRQEQKRIPLNQVADEVLDMALRTHTKHIAVEITGQEEPIQFLFETKAKERGLEKWVVFHWVGRHGAPKGDYGPSANAAKVAAASLFLPYYESGYIYHEEALRGGPLEAQERSYPKCGLWDCIDCASYIPEMLRLAGLWFETIKIPEREKQRLPGWQESRDLGDRIRSGAWRQAS